MNLSMSGHHVEVTPAMREYALNKLDRPKRHFNEVVGARVRFRVQKCGAKSHQQTVAVNLHYKSHDIFVKRTGGDSYAIVDTVMDTLDRQVVRYKGRLRGHRSIAPKRLDVGAA
jgi:putative sigma-54 modulation protein